MKELNDNEMNAVSGGAFYEGELQIHTVKPNETLKEIADRFGTFTGVLMELNPQIPENLALRPGMELQVPKLPLPKK